MMANLFCHCSKDDKGVANADKKLTNDEIFGWSRSFDNLMKSAAGQKCFAEFLKGEYSDENILFWKACEELKRETNAEKIEVKARLIYDDYVSVFSPDVSLDSRVRKIVNNNMLSPNPHTHSTRPNSTMLFQLVACFLLLSTVAGNSALDQFKGTWKFASEQNIDAFLKQYGMSDKLRAFYDAVEPTLKISTSGDSGAIIYIRSANHSHATHFTLGQAADRLTVDGKNTTTTFTLNGSTLVQTDKGTEGRSDVTIEYSVNGNMLTVITSGNGVSATTVYKKQETASLLDQFKGTWQFVSEQNMDAFLKQYGMSGAVLKVFESVKPTLKISTSGHSGVIIYIRSPSHSHVTNFTLGQAADRLTIDGEKTTTTFALNGSTLVQTDKGTTGRSDATIEYSVNGNTLTTISSVNGVSATTVYKKKTTSLLGSLLQLIFSLI